VRRDLIFVNSVPFSVIPGSRPRGFGDRPLHLARKD
jgi:hypothetical protein